MTVEVFLDDTPGETRGIVRRDGRFEHLLIQREDDPPQERLGARSIGRVTQVEAAFGAAFVDVGTQRPAFLPLGSAGGIRDGDRLEVETTAEPRDGKGAVVRRLGPGEGEPRLLAAGPDVRAVLDTLAPGHAPLTGVEAIQAAWDAEEEALATGDLFAEWALDLAVERTRALVAVDIDYAHLPGRDAKRGRQRANLEGLRQAARLIRLKNWGGLVAVDLVGTRLDGEAIGRAARAAFGDGPEVVIGPLNRFGVLQLSLPWRRAPVEGLLRDQKARAITIVRHLRHAMLSDPATPRWVAVCAPDEAEAVGPLAARLGPRAAVRVELGLGAGRFRIEEG